MEWTRVKIYRLEMGLLVLVLIVLGIAHFSKLSPQRQRQLELEMALEQLYYLEQAHFEEYGRYFDPTSPEEGVAWEWMQAYVWDVRLREDGFYISARGDLDGDGEMGVWSVGSEDAVPRQVVAD